ncbi:hypothetical protein C0Z10_09350 [Acidipropionibacterium jensenii]|uniref:Uncharacterized protein n=1 Tax=Acidipropionibacterium jensenii TaxID=1749 RepID=A0A3Q9UEX5_9ACTN|nr:hypothetical protein [Acidipropionibacterium jensenii]AZZ39924.1 hypothetical protein C0Z10_09350 [Acidipropionibacterium jensenii]
MRRRSLASIVAACLLGASLGLGALPANAAPVSSNRGSTSTVSTQGLNSMMCYWLPAFCR